MNRKIVTYKNNTFTKMRVNAGLSQEQVAQAAGCSVSTVQKWEDGMHHPRKVYMRLLKKTYADFDLEDNLTFAYNTAKAPIFNSKIRKAA